MPRLVLLVDDEPSILSSTARVLTDAGFRVLTAADPAAAFDLMRRERPDLILQDVRMPGLDLDEYVRMIRADASLASIPIVLFSAAMDVEEVADRLGLPDWFEKPFKPHDLVEAIHRIAPPEQTL